MFLPNSMLTSRFRIAGLCGLFFLYVGAGSGQIAGPVPERIRGEESVGDRAVERRTADIMADAAAHGPRKNVYIKREFEIPGRESRPQDPAARLDRQTAPGQAHTAPSMASASTSVSSGPFIAQTLGLTFDGVTGPTQTGAFPPDSMGAVGPSQFFIFVNGRLRTFNKTTGAADGVINADPDIFFSSVMTNAPVNFTSDPQVRYDRLSGRWILIIIDVPSSSSSSVGDMPNRVLIAVSNAASAGVITANTVWSFYFIPQNTVGGANTGQFLDYPSLGVDNNALYIGGNMFGAVSGSFAGTSAFVVRKSSILNGGPIVVTAFRGLISGGDGPDSPRGVDNYDPAATEGYIIGPSDSTFGRLVMRRISNPGGTPAISANIAITVNATALPINVNASGTSGQLDALDDRLFAAHIRNGRLWTAHNIAVDSTGVASPSRDRDAARWYELSVPVGSGTPTVVESGTIFDSAATASSARWYWIPSVVVSGQGHAAFGFSTAGPAFRINAATTGRLATDTLGTVNAPTLLTGSSTSYNPSDGSPHRWGDYSFTSVDPSDDMTMWTIQEFCDGSNTYGLEVAKLIAPAPATPSSASSSVATGLSSISVTITGTSSSGSGFFDPGTGFAKRIGASATGGVTVNSITYVDPTHVTLNLNTTAASAGSQNVTITNPDGQIATGTGILTVGLGGPTPTPSPTPTPGGTPTPTPTPTPAPTGPAVMLNPPPGSTFTSSSVTFQWSAGSATGYVLTLGNSPGGVDIYYSTQLHVLSTTVNNIPTDGRTVYVRLYSQVNNSWLSNSYTYKAFNPSATPTPTPTPVPTPTPTPTSTPTATPTPTPTPTATPTATPTPPPANIVATPLFSPNGGTFSRTVTVKLFCNTPGATMRYTTNGSTPTTSSSLYTSDGIMLSGAGTRTVKAIGVKSGLSNSAVATATFTIN